MRSLSERPEMVEYAGGKLSIVRQSKLLGLHRSSLYYTPSTESEENLEIMKFLDRQYKYPYLLKDITVDHVNPAWSIDITYIPMKHGFMYLFAIIDVYSRYVVGWSLSNMMSSEWCVDCINAAIAEHGSSTISLSNGFGAA